MSLSNPVSPYLQHSVVESAVGLVVSELGDQRNAMTVSFFSEVAHYPTALWVSIAQSAYTHELISASGRFSLIVLHVGQKDLASACGFSSGRSANKCANLDLYRAHSEYWFLDGAISSVACRVRSAREGNGHTLFIADILASDVETRSRTRRHLLTTDMGSFPASIVS